MDRRPSLMPPRIKRALGASHRNDRGTLTGTSNRRSLPNRTALGKRWVDAARSDRFAACGRTRGWTFGDPRRSPSGSTRARDRPERGTRPERLEGLGTARLPAPHAGTGVAGPAGWTPVWGRERPIGRATLEPGRAASGPWSEHQSCGRSGDPRIPADAANVFWCDFET